MRKPAAIAFLAVLWPVCVAAQDVTWSWVDAGAASPGVIELKPSAISDGARLLAGDASFDDKVNAITQLPDGAMVFGARSGLYVLKYRLLEKYTGARYDLAKGGDVPGNSPLPAAEVRALAVGRDGALWVGTASGLCRVSRGTWKVLQARETEAKGLTVSQDLAGGLSDIQELYVASDGRVVAGSRCAGVTVIDPGASTVTTVFHNQDVNNWVEGIAEDQGHVLWVGIKALGVLRWDGRTARLHEREGWIPQIDIRALCIDHSGTLWLGTHGGLGARFADGSSRTFTKPSPLADDNVWDLCVLRNGQVWANTGQGIVMFDGKEWFHAQAAGLPRNCCGAPLFEAADGTFWVGGHPGVVRNPHFTFTKRNPVEDRIVVERRRIESIFPRVEVSALRAADAAGRVYACLGDKILRYDGKMWQELAPEAQSRPVYFVKSDSKGRVWIGTSGAGLFGFDGEKALRFNADEAGGLSVAVIYDMAEDSCGTLYFATQGGVFRLAGDNWGLLPGMPQSQYSRVLVDGKDRVWCMESLLISGPILYEAGRVVMISSRQPLDHWRVLSMDKAASGEVFVKAQSRDGNETMILVYREGGFVPMSFWQRLWNGL